MMTSPVRYETGHLMRSQGTFSLHKTLEALEDCTQAFVCSSQLMTANVMITGISGNLVSRVRRPRVSKQPQQVSMELYAVLFGMVHN